jgi:hypothetical protein
MRATALIALLLVPLLALSGCGDSAEDDALAAVCGARDDIAAQVEELQGLTITTATTTQVGESLQAIGDGLKTIEESRAELSDDRREEVQAANDAFADEVRKIATSVGTTISIEGATAQLEEALGQLATSYRDTFGELDCP